MAEDSKYVKVCRTLDIDAQNTERNFVAMVDSLSGEQLDVLYASIPGSMKHVRRQAKVINQILVTGSSEQGRLLDNMASNWRDGINAWPN